MKKAIISSLLLTCLFALHLSAQDNLSWSKHVKLADDLYAKAQYADAGEHYRAAFKQKVKKTELAYKAGECFFIIKDYRNAADAWQYVKDANNTYRLIGLRYSRCLKQSGEYETASAELVNFLGHYQGADKTVISQIVQNELRGCELAAQFAVKGESKDVKVEHLNGNVNTPETEFAPFPFGDEALYFSSTMAKRAEIYRSVKAGGDWGKATPIDNFPIIQEDHFCNGTLTPDQSRFYFTRCKSQEIWGGLTSKCEIYVTRRTSKSWSAPERLPDYINEAGVTSTHPFVVHDNGTEILYFASNRAGGMGGMDIWYATREVRSNGNDFTLPINAGSRVNTMGDEITPYYDQLDGTLYFGSNGQISIGGFDIFSAKGAKANWDRAENPGPPLNSPADDFSFIKTTSGKGGFFVSNRTFGMQKINTTHEDIFSFTYTNPARQWVARGEVYDKATGKKLDDVEVAVYELSGNGQKSFVSKIISPDGTYDFAVKPSNKYYLEALKDGFFPGTYEFDTYDFAAYTDFGAAIYMDSYDETGGDGDLTGIKEKPEPPVRQPVSNQGSNVSKPGVTKPGAPGSDPYAAKDMSPNVKTDVITEAPRLSGTYFKIQIIAVAKYDQFQSIFDDVKEMARLDTEFIVDRKLYRVLLADYNSVEDAKSDLDRVRTMKFFKDAYIVQYRDGERVGTVNE